MYFLLSVYSVKLSFTLVCEHKKEKKYFSFLLCQTMTTLFLLFYCTSLNYYSGTFALKTGPWEHFFILNN